MTPAALYARVSTARQEQEATIDSQLAAVTDYAAVHGYHLDEAHHFIDQAVSGARLDRPALDRLRDLASEQAFAVVLCLSPDRLARSYIYQRLLLDELSRIDVRVIFVSQPDLPDTPQSELLLGIQGLFAEYERAVISERMRRGKLHRLRTGQQVAPMAPYGYHYRPVSEPNGGRWEIIPTQAQVVTDIFQWYTSGWTVPQIARRLNQHQIPGPQGGDWVDSTVRRLLQQSAYMGTAYYGRSAARWETVGQPRRQGRGRLQFPRYQQRPEADWIEMTVPAIISRSLWEQAQECFRMNQRFAVRNNHRNQYLLRSLLVCGVCGHTLNGRTARERQSYGCRYGGKHRAPDVPAHSCTIAADEIEPLVWDALAELLRTPERLIAAWHAMLGTDDEQPDDVARIGQRQRALDRQWQRLLDAYQDGLLDKDELTARKVLLDAEQQRLAAQLKTAARREQAEQYERDLALTCEAFVQRIEDALASPSFETKQEVIRLLIEQIVVDADTITIKHIVPAEDDYRLCRLEPTHSTTGASR